MIISAEKMALGGRTEIQDGGSQHVVMLEPAQGDWMAVYWFQLGGWWPPCWPVSVVQNKFWVPLEYVARHHQLGWILPGGESGPALG